MQITTLLFQIFWLSFILPTQNIDRSYIQDQNVFSLDHFYVFEQVILDSVDYSEHYRSVGGFMKFYRPAPNENIHMSNVMEKSGTQSYGEVTGIINDTITIDNKTIDVVYFDWHYSNSYNDDAGIAKIVFYTTIIDGKDKFVCIMFLDGDKISLYSGDVINPNEEQEVKP